MNCWRLLLGWSLLFCSVLFSCEPNERRIVAENRSLIDSLANEQIQVMREELDSICDAQFDARVELAADSIMDVRIEEIKKMLSQ